MIKKCLVCGKEFVSRANNKIYCSVECSRAAARQQERTNRAKRKASQWDKASTGKSLDEIVSEIERYNNKHGTHLTYGQWQTLKFFGKV